MATTSGGSGQDNIGCGKAITAGGGTTIIDAQNLVHGYFGASVEASSSDLNFRPGKRATDITAFAANGSNTQVTTTADHLLEVGDIITITGTTNYNDIHEIKEIVDAKNFVIFQTFVADDGTGNYILPDSYITPIVGKYFVAVSGSGEIAIDAPTFEFTLYCNGVIESKIEVALSNLNSEQPIPLIGLCDAPQNARIWLGVKNTTNATNILIPNLTMVVCRQS